jgi:hypothetical protein
MISNGIQVPIFFRVLVDALWGQNPKCPFIFEFLNSLFSKISLVKEGSSETPMEFWYSNTSQESLCDNLSLKLEQFSNDIWSFLGHHSLEWEGLLPMA